MLGKAVEELHLVCFADGSVFAPQFPSRLDLEPLPWETWPRIDDALSLGRAHPFYPLLPEHFDGREQVQPLLIFDVAPFFEVGLQQLPVLVEFHCCLCIIHSAPRVRLVSHRRPQA